MMEGVRPVMVVLISVVSLEECSVVVCCLLTVGVVFWLSYVLLDFWTRGCWFFGGEVLVPCPWLGMVGM